MDGWAKAWKRREATRGAATNFAVFGRSPPPAVAEQSRQTHDGGSSSTICSSSGPRSVKKTLSATDLPPSEKAQPKEHDARRKCGGSGCWSGAEDTEHSLLDRRKSTNIDGFARGGATAAPLPTEATAAAAVSGETAVTAAGAAAVARRRAEEEQQAAGKTFASAAAAAAGGGAGGAGSNSTSHGANSDDTTVGSSSPDSSRSASPTSSFTAETVAAADTSSVDTGRSAGRPSAPAVGEATRKGVLQRRASGSAAVNKRRGGWGGGMSGRPASFSLPSKSSTVARDPGSSGSVAIGVSVGAGEEAMASMPDEDRAFLDELLMEIRFPLISTSFLCQGTYGFDIFASCVVFRSP